MKTQIRILQAWLALSTLAAWNCGNAAALNLATSPLFLGTSVDANVFFELDDSGSMDWETLTNEYDYFKNYWDSSTDAAKIDNGMWDSSCSVISGSGSNAISYCSASNSSGKNGWTGRHSYGYIFREADRLYQSTDAYGSVALYSSDNTEPTDSDWRVRSSSFNLLYYNPAVTYAPWTSSLSSVTTSFTAARGNPQSGSDGYSSLRNLTGFVFETWTDDHGYTGTRPDGPSTATNTPNGIVDLWDSRTKYTINADHIVITTYTTAADIAGIGVSCNLTRARATVPYSACYGTTATTVSTLVDPTWINPWGRTLAQEQQNIANWYTYARKRSYVAKGAIGAVVENSDDFRYGISLINKDDHLFVQVPSSAVTSYTSHNADLLDDLFSYEWDAVGTPLRAGLENIGKYFDGALSGKTDPIFSQCQQNFTILLTDGYWSGDSVASAIGDADGDGRSKTLADVARYYYTKDLSSLANTVPTSVIDPNSKQHMVTFGVAFGVKGDLVDTDGDGYPNPKLSESNKWGDDPLNDDNEAGKIDDLWHASFNSKGMFVNARTAEDLVVALQDSLSEISDRVGSSAAVATNSGSLNAGSHLFQARFDSGEWAGQLLAFSITDQGTIDPVADWDAGDVLDTQNYNTGRTIITYNPNIDFPVGGAVEGRGIAFRFPTAYKSPSTTTDMNSGQIEKLMKYAPYALDTSTSSRITANQNHGSAVLNYLRGQRTNEGSGTYAFRVRGSALGDIVDSDPQYVGAPRGRYPDSLQSAAYSSFKSANAARTPMVYVGGNDGMLHAFRESDGVEKLAYVPDKVYTKLPELTRTDYAHTYFVNGKLAVVDAWLPNYNSTGAWRSILVGGLGRGGQGIYALDVTDPSSFTEANAGTIALWEFTDADSADLGYTYSQISVAKMANGKWAAIFGNGYNNTESDGAVSSTGRAYLYIVDIETGDLIKKIDTGVGSTSTPNGLGSPAVIDTDGDYDMDLIYAGDLYGNMWKFDVSSSNTNNWAVAYKTGSTPKPLFTTNTGSSQPITTRPVITTHPTKLDGYMVYFGTGKYLETNDNDPSGANTQAFYGIWDKNLSSLTAFTTSNLVQQYITNQYAKEFNGEDADGENDVTHVLRDVSDNAVDYSTKLGWWIELKPQKVSGTANTSNFGEKQVSNALVRDGKVIFSTLVPSQNQCDFGGNSFIMELDFENGGQLSEPPFDANGDGKIDATDTYVGGIDSDVGIVGTLNVLLDGDGKLRAFGSGSGGNLGDFTLNPGANTNGRQSWRQIR